MFQNEADEYGQDWQNSAFYPTAPPTENADYSVYEPSNVGTDIRNIENCNIYEPASSNGAVVNNATGIYLPSTIPETDETDGNFIGSYSSNFGAVLYSSLTTLTNGNDNINPELNTSNIVYNNTDLSDLAYMSNVSLNNVSNSDCFYNGYLAEEGYDVSDAHSVNNSQFHYQQPQSTNFVSPAQPIPSQFPSQTTEECFDKSSDSAVSSMSSDQVPSYSDNVSFSLFFMNS